MIIAINSSHFIKLPNNEFFYNYFVKFAASKPEHQFIFITPPPIDKQLVISKNTIQVISTPKANNPLMWKVWLNYTLPGIARKHKADILIHTGGVCSLRTKVPQWLFISDLSFLFSPHFFSKQQQYFLKKNMLSFLHKAKTIVTASDFLTKQIIQEYAIDEEKINGFHLMVGDHYQPINWNEKEAVKEKYAEGKEYFLFSGEIDQRSNLMNLLKAFSFFKKRQKSNMQLIITVNVVSTNDPFTENFKSYKYRKEVNLLIGMPEKDLAKITAAAYAFIYPVLYEGMAIFPLQAMQCEVPVITSNTGALIEKTGDAALLVEPANFEDIADKMMLVFKDEAKRTELIKSGKVIAQKNNKNKMDDVWWESILKTIG